MRIRACLAGEENFKGKPLVFQRARARSPSSWAGGEGKRGSISMYVLKEVDEFLPRTPVEELYFF